MIRRDCIHYHCEHDMGASIDCCTLRGLGNCPCSNDCDDYANKNKIYSLGLDVFRKRKEASAQPETCEGCKHLGKWENEVEYGYPSPCTRCKRRVGDHYER